MKRDATAIACANVALVKYWGNRVDEVNAPATGSISVTLRDLTTTTAVTFDDGPDDRVRLDGQPAGREAQHRVTAVLDLVRRAAGLRSGARVVSDNDFPTGAGLASSASGFAALALAASRAAGLRLDGTTLSGVARRGSGSAARSVFGGIVELHAGIADDGRDALAEPLAEPDWPLAVLVAITSEGPKAVSSAEGMRRTVRTSPLYEGWVRSAPADLDALRAALRARDLEQVGELAEHSCLKMHGLMLSTRPPLIYGSPATLRVIEAVRAHRDSGVGAWFTVDAGPQVKVLCAPADAASVERRVAAVDGVIRVISTAPGPGARLVDPAS